MVQILGIFLGRSADSHELVVIQESYNTPLEHTPGNPTTQLWKDSLYNLLGDRLRGVFQRCVETTLEVKIGNSELGKFNSQLWFAPENGPAPGSSSKHPFLESNISMLLAFFRDPCL